MRRCPIMSGTVALCFSASARNCAARSRHDIAIECHIVRDPEAVEDREQQQRVFGRLSQRFSLLDQQTCLLRSRLGFGGGIAFDMDEWGYERDLKLDLLATQRRRAGQGRDLLEGAGELGRGFDQRRARPATAVPPCPTDPRPSRSARPRCSDAPGSPAGSRQSRRIGFQGFRRYGREARVSARAAACHRPHPAPAHA